MPMSRCMRVDEVVRDLDEREKSICFGHDKTGPESKSSCAYGTSFKNRDKFHRIDCHKHWKRPRHKHLKMSPG